MNEIWYGGACIMRWVTRGIRVRNDIVLQIMKEYSVNAVKGVNGVSKVDHAYGCRYTRSFCLRAVQYTL